MGDLSKNFGSREFFDPKTWQDVLDDKHLPYWHISPLLVERLEQIREWAGAPITITCGFRTQDQQDKLRAEDKTNTKFSFHQQGIAADIVVHGKDPIDVFNFCVKYFKDGAFGLYSSFCHVDVRPSRKPITWRKV